MPWSFIIPAAVSLFTGSQNRQAASQASDAATRSAENAQAFEKQQFDKQMELSAPYREAGVVGQNRLMELLGLGSNTGAEGYGRYAKDFSMADYQADPGYGFRLSEGMKQLGSQARAQGGAVSGRTMMGAQNYAQGLASQEYNNAFNRYQTNRTNQLAPLGSLMTSGQNAAAGTGAQTGEYGARISNLMTGAGENQGNALMAAQAQNASSYEDISNLYGEKKPNFRNLFGSTGQSGMYADPTLIPMQAGGGY
jgi:hypothetical protein